MNPELNEFMSERQYRKICKYWNTIDDLKRKLEKFMSKGFQLSYLNCDDDYSDCEYLSEEEITRENQIREERMNYFVMLKEQIHYYEQEYEKYVGEIGYEFLDRTQPEVLFKLLNDGLDK